ncbi:BrnA antitoxin family protein [Telluria aromaticivorans]|uniref:BrnA antitoxin family protein n=1 Tax=Telluria aromaticivorans TaxID=2725995 RepID=A0A7Y2K2G9_9BURK|nr:BrnA antitoxin family protein [Telluria aromaticivorans]NNG24963.1 BrnA antitoxin family protein [Telluria aromaticivorans]
MNIESTLQATQVAAPVRRARPPKRKTRITIYLDDEVLNEFRNLSERCGTGYQTLINAALRHRLAAPVGETGLA